MKEIIECINRLKEAMKLSMEEKDMIRFFEGNQRNNIIRGKITSAAFFFVSTFILLLSFLINREDSFEMLHICYEGMYLLLILISSVFYRIFNKMEKNFFKITKLNHVIGFLFLSFILGWSAGLSLLDYMNDRQVLIYLITVIAVAVTPVYRPFVLLSIYIIINTAFLIAISILSNSADEQYSIFLNTTTCILMSWAVAFMRYKHRTVEFVNHRKLQQSTRELMRLNLELEDANHKLEVLSQTDGLTCIYNRSAFNKIMIRDWRRCKKHQQHLSLIMIDIDFFKAYNDNYGHQAGDVCLKRVAELLSECMERANDSVIRYGGEEFAIILPGVEEEPARLLAEKLRRNVEELNVTHEYSAVSDRITISLGVHCIIPGEEDIMDDFIRDTDRALYEAKRSNRNKVIVA